MFANFHFRSFPFFSFLKHIPAPAIPQPPNRNPYKCANQRGEPVVWMRIPIQHDPKNNIAHKCQADDPKVDDGRPFIAIIPFGLCEFFAHKDSAPTTYFFERLTNHTINTTMPTSGTPNTSSIIKKPKPIIMISIPAYSTIKTMPFTLKASG